MPRIRRWFPVSHDINTDPEVWEMTDRFGDRALRVWMEMLAFADRHEGRLKGTASQWAQILLRVFSRGNPRWIRRDSERLLEALYWMSEKGWIAIREGSEASLEIVNYSEYHRTKEPIKSQAESERTPSEPSEPTRPSDPSEPTNQKRKTLAHEDMRENGFSTFWQVYPRKKSKGQARKVWAKLQPDEQLQNRILGAIERAKTSAEWTKQGGEFIPYPGSWLSAEGWEDQPTEGVSKRVTARQLWQEADRERSS